MMYDNERFSRFITKWLAVGIMALATAVALTGCNTVKGLSLDIHAAAQGIQNEMAEGAER